MIYDELVRILNQLLQRQVSKNNIYIKKYKNSIK